MNTEKRRDFLKKSGMGAIAGAGALAGLTAMAREQLSASTDKEVPQGKVRWGMVIDMRKCPDECTDCIDACHRVHNVPDFDNPKDEIKWVWKSPRKKVFPSKSLQFAPRERQEKPFLTSAISAQTHPVPGSARPGRRFHVLTESCRWIFIAALVVVSVWQDVPMVPEVSTGVTRVLQSAVSIPPTQPGNEGWWKNAISASKGSRNNNCPTALRSARKRL